MSDNACNATDKLWLDINDSEFSFIQKICCNGHYTSLVSDRHVCCRHCGGQFVSSNFVDETNDDHYGVISVSKILKNFIISEAAFETDSNGRKRQVSPTIYKVPSPEETTALRSYWDEAPMKHILISEKVKP